MDFKVPYMKEFFDYMVTYKDTSKNTITNYRIDLKVFIEFTKGEIPTKIEDFKNFTKYLLNERKDARTTINRRLSALKSYYNFLYDEKIIHTDVAPRIKYVRTDPRKFKEILPQEDIFEILKGINNVRDRAMLETLYSTGIREGELSNLNIQDIDFENEFVAIIKSKTRRSRVVPISKEALKWIKAYIGVRKDGPLFLNNRAERISERSIYTICKNYFNLPPHDLRHAFTTHLLENGLPTKAIAEMLGHKNDKMVNEVYSHINQIRLTKLYKERSRMNERD